MRESHAVTIFRGPSPPTLASSTPGGGSSLRRAISPSWRPVAPLSFPTGTPSPTTFRVGSRWKRVVRRVLGSARAWENSSRRSGSARLFTTSVQLRIGGHRPVDAAKTGNRQSDSLRITPVPGQRFECSPRQPVWWADFSRHRRRGRSWCRQECRAPHRP